MTLDECRAELRIASVAYQRHVADNPSDRETSARLRQRVQDLIAKRARMERNQKQERSEEQR